MYCFATTASCGSSGSGADMSACSEISAVRTVSAGLHSFLRMSKQIVPVSLLMFGCQILVANFICAKRAARPTECTCGRSKGIEHALGARHVLALGMLLEGVSGCCISSALSHRSGAPSMHLGSRAAGACDHMPTAIALCWQNAAGSAICHACGAPSPLSPLSRIGDVYLRGDEWVIGWQLDVDGEFAALVWRTYGTLDRPSPFQKVGLILQLH